jgi:hypothetical protein
LDALAQNRPVSVKPAQLGVAGPANASEPGRPDARMGAAIALLHPVAVRVEILDGVQRAAEVVARAGGVDRIAAQGIEDVLLERGQPQLRAGGVLAVEVLGRAGLVFVDLGVRFNDLVERFLHRRSQLGHGEVALVEFLDAALGDVLVGQAAGRLGRDEANESVLGTEGVAGKADGQQQRRQQQREDSAHTISFLAEQELPQADTRRAVAYLMPCAALL